MTQPTYEDLLSKIPPPIGSIVRREPGPGKLPAGLYVVLAESSRRGGGMRIAKLGGDGNRYWTVPVDAAKVVTPEELGIEVT